MEKWLPCRITLMWGKTSKIARLHLPDISRTLEPKMRIVLMFKHPDGSITQTVGVVERTIKRWENYNYVSVLIPWPAAMTLARLANVSVERGKKVEIYDYTVQIREANLPPLR